MAYPKQAIPRLENAIPSRSVLSLIGGSEMVDLTRVYGMTATKLSCFCPREHGYQPQYNGEQGKQYTNSGNSTVDAADKHKHTRVAVHEYKVRQEVMEWLFKVNEPNISLSLPVNSSCSCTSTPMSLNLMGWFA